MNGFVLAPAEHIGRWSINSVRSLGKIGYLNTRVITAELSGVSGDISAALQSLSGTLTLADSTFLSLNHITTRLERAGGSLGRLISDTLLASRAESLVEELNLLFEDIRANPQKYVHLSIF